MKPKLFQIAFIALLLSLIKCSDNYKSSENSLPESNDTSAALMDTIPVITDTVAPLPEIKYLFIKPPKRNRYKFLIENYDTTGTEIILALNRVDKNHIRIPDSIIVPDTIISNKLLYSPFPSHINRLDSVKKILLIDQRVQAFAAYEFGKLVNWGPTSTGKKSTPTPNGLFHTNWKSKETISTDNEEWILKWYFNLDNFRGISIHQYDMPGYPASHACARMLDEDAKWIYYWAEQWILTRDEEFIIAYGTPVIIYGEFNFKGVKPWLLPPSEPEKAIVSEDELNDVLDKYLITILTRQKHREEIINPHLSMSN